MNVTNSEIGKSYEFNIEELKLLEDSLRYLIACLDEEAFLLYADLSPLLTKVEAMVKVKSGALNQERKDV